MMRALGLCAALALLGLPGYAQQTLDTTRHSSGRLAAHYIGLQANQLIRQLLNMGGSTAVINNPYLVVYSVNSTQSGWGANFSLGYTLNESKDGDAITNRETKINDVFLRLGFEKKTTIGKRWILAAGGDFVMDNKKNTTTTENSVTSFSVETINSSKGFGLGPRIALNFQLSEHVLLGTEANYYLKFTNTSSSVSQQGSVQKEESDQKNFQLNVPAVLFLIVKL
jgi:hypothetical protein